MVVYEPVLKEDEFFHSKVIRDLDTFKTESNIILANRMAPNWMTWRTQSIPVTYLVMIKLK